MKCPKCRYLSFEPELRCKHCGFDFSMADSGPSLRRFDELEQQDPDLPMVDLQLRSTEVSEIPQPVMAARRAVAQPAAAVALAERVPQARPMAPPIVRPIPAAPATDLPLFIKQKSVTVPDATAIPDHDAEDDENHERANRVPAAPRPLVVRRRAPEPTRTPPASGLLDYIRRVETETGPVVAAARVPTPVRKASSAVLPPAMPGEVDAFARLKAASLDLAILAALNIAVVLLTLRQCDLSIAQIASVPVLPLVGFLASITVGYLLSFSVVNGKTIGKMAFGLRVVADAEVAVDGMPTPRQMSYRALLTVPSILLLGLGFLPGLVGEGRAVHDRLTHTRVVRE